MKILLAGRVGRYPERLLALREAGHGFFYCTLPPLVGAPPLDRFPDSVPFTVLKHGAAGARVAELVEEYEIDVVYSMKNVWDGSVELVNEILDAGVGVPVVRHYKEHFCEPSEAERRNLTETTRQIYINEHSLRYFVDAYGVRRDTALILDTDFVPRRYMTDELRPKLSDADGEPHVLIAGGNATHGNRHDFLELSTELARHGVHVHLYGEKYVGLDKQGVWGVGHVDVQEAYERLATDSRIHIHPHVQPARFTYEWSIFDGGVMHTDAPDAREAAFERMNVPNRLSPYLCAGLPIFQQRGHQTAMVDLVAERGFGLLYDDAVDLAEQLRDKEALRGVQREAVAARFEYSYEHHLPTLLAFLAEAAAT